MPGGTTRIAGVRAGWVCRVGTRTVEPARVIVSASVWPAGPSLYARTENGTTLVSPLDVQASIEKDVPAGSATRGRSTARAGSGVPLGSALAASRPQSKAGTSASNCDRKRPEATVTARMKAAAFSRFDRMGAPQRDMVVA